MRAGSSWLSASSLRLKNVRRCSLGMSSGSVSSWAMTGRSDMWNIFTLWCFGWILLFPFSRRLTFAHLKRQHGYWVLVNYDCSISWWMNTLKYHDFHDETTERKTHPCCYSCYCFPYCLKNVSANINRSSYDEIT